MYFKFENRDAGKRFTFFKGERLISGKKIASTDKCVFGSLSEGIKTGEDKNGATWVNDYWNVCFCGKAYEKALSLSDFDRIMVVEMNVRNVFSANTKKSYPKITVTDFDIIQKGESMTNEPVDMLPLPADDEDLGFE